MKIGTLEVGPGHPCAIVAEIGNAHGGSLGRAIHLLDAAKACGASAAKLQAYTPDELVALRGDGPAPAQWGEQGYTMRSLYEKARTPLEWLPTLYAHAESIGLPLFSSVFGPESLAALERVGNPVYKIAALDNKSDVLAEMVRATGKPLIVSGATVRDVSPWREVPDGSWKGARARRNPALTLYCPPGYPQPVPFTDLRARFDRQRCDGDVAGCDIVGPEFDGFSYHGTDPNACVIAATLGATILEAHFMLDAEPSELEANVSLGEEAFAQMVADVRATEVLLGD
jgi:pseudaminic acid synthase